MAAPSTHSTASAAAPTSPPDGCADPTAAPADPTGTSGDASASSPGNADEAFAHALNDLLVTTFHSIERFEEQSLRSFDGLDLSVNEAHVIEAVGRGTPQHPGGMTVSQVAAALSVRVPTATAAVNKLAAKGLLAKERSAHDGRAVHVLLTQTGRRAFRLHDLFHRRMVDAVAGNMSPEERSVLATGVQKLKAFFEKAANGDAEPARLVHNRQDGAAPARATAGTPPRPATGSGDNGIRNDELED